MCIFWMWLAILWYRDMQVKKAESKRRQSGIRIVCWPARCSTLATHASQEKRECFSTDPSWKYKQTTFSRARLPTRVIMLLEWSRGHLLKRMSYSIFPVKAAYGKIKCTFNPDSFYKKRKLSRKEQGQYWTEKLMWCWQRSKRRIAANNQILVHKY